MARFGNYVTVHELRRTGLTVVYSGRDDKSPDDKFAIKVRKDNALFTDKEHEKTGANNFLNSAQLQQKFVLRGSQHWAPIHKFGSFPEGTFYVTNKFEHSLEHLIDLHAELGAKALHAIIKQIAEGLIELKKSYKRPHGNLKATNVFITGAAPELKVVLSDPLADKSIDAKVHWYADLRAIGELIYQLVVHRPAPSLAGARIPDSKEWAGLKRQKDEWRDLCERLLSVTTRPNAITLESLVEKLTELGKSKPILSYRRLAVVGLLMIAAVMALYFVKKHTPDKADPDEWQELCDYYNKWIGPLYTGLGYTEKTYDNNFAKEWKDKDPSLGRIIGNKKEDPNTIWRAGYPARLRGRGLDRDTKSALEAVKYIKSFFTLNDPNAQCEPWPMLVEIQNAANKFEQEDSLKPAVKYLNDLVKAVEPPSRTIVQEVNDIFDLKMNNTLGELISLQEDVNGYKDTWKQVYNDLLSETSQYPTGEVSKEIFNNWSKQATGYRLITDEDPRSGEEWRDTLENTEKIIELFRTYKSDSVKKHEEGLNDFKGKTDKLSNIPGIVKNKEKIKQEVDQLNKTYSNLKAEIHNTWNKFVFNKLQQGLNACYLLNEEQSQIEETILSLWNKWNDLKNTNDIVEPNLEDRIKKLIEIQSFYKNNLIQTATTSTNTEAVYAAWKRLGKLQDSSWPNDHSDLIQDRKIQDRLQKEFETIKLNDEPRGEHLLNDIVGTGLTYEIEFISRNSLGDKALSKMVEYANKINRDGSLNDRQELEPSTRQVANFLAGDDWKEGKINITAFSEKSDLYNIDVTIETFRQWLDEVGDYKILEEEDPRTQYSWDDKIPKIERKIKDELTLHPQGDYMAELEEQNKNFNNTKESIAYIDKLPRIEKNRDDINNKYEKLWEELLEIERRLRPSYCRRLYYDTKNQLIFAEGISIRNKFKPVIDANGNPAEFSDWDQIRQAIESSPKQEKWIDFLYTTEVNESINVGWPKYIQSTEDPNVILRFIPAGNGNPEPFYMAIHEITNAQYETFLLKSKANKKGRAYYDPNDDILLEWDELLPYPLFWENHNEQLKEYPVTYVTHYGAQSYADWLAPGKAQLPTNIQHEYAFRATSYTLPWSGDRSKILTFAHVRAEPWQTAAENWNNRGLAQLPEPLGAKLNIDKDYVGNPKNREVNINRVVVSTSYPNDREYSAWPIASATEANEWDLFDMIGNVWEWCREPESICGGSCLAPPEYIPDCEGYSPDNYSTKYNESACDIGFRVIVSIQ